MVTYTDNKKLNKPANGEFPDTWDVPVNQDWDIIDKALGSAVTFTVGASDITLSISDAQNQRIVLTGTPGASRYIIIPFKYLSATTAVGGMWIVDNQTNADQYVVTEAPGTTGVTVAAGRKALVYSDGTDVKFADEVRLIAGNGISVSGSTVALSSPVSVANGGTGLSTLTSGNVILGNGTSAPSFVAPGTAGNVLTSNGSTWLSAPNAGGGGGGGITSITFATASGMGFTFTPNNLTTPGGTTTLSGTLAIANGGTGVSTIASGIVKSNGSLLTGGNNIALGSEVSGTLPISNGGTGTTVISSGFVKSTGASLTSVSAVQLNTSDVTGQLGISNGGTGVASFASGFIKSNGSALSGGNSVNLSSDVGSSVLPIANGGTNNAYTGTGNFVRADGPTGLAGTWNFASISASGNITASTGTITGSNVTATTTLTGSNVVLTGSGGSSTIGFNNSSVSQYIVATTSTSIMGFYLNGPLFSASPSNFSAPANLNVGGIPYAPQANFTVVSDQRVKKNIAPYTKTLGDIETLNPITFEYNGQYGTKDDGILRVGLLAQDVQQSRMSEIIEPYEYKDPDTGQTTELYIINPSELVFALINTVKDMDARIKALEAKVGP